MQAGKSWFFEPPWRQRWYVVGLPRVDRAVTHALYTESDPHLTRSCDWPFEEALAPITPSAVDCFTFFDRKIDIR